MTFAENCTQRHNMLRMFHKVPPLRLDDHLTKVAKDLIAVLKSGKPLTKKLYSPYNINQFETTEREPTAEFVVKTWYGDAEKYNYDTEKVDESFFSFTQIVWKKTTDMGIAKMSDGPRKWYVVAVYNPPGNIAGKFKENVKKPLQKPITGSSSATSKKTEDETDTKPDTKLVKRVPTGLGRKKLNAQKIQLTKYCLICFPCLKGRC